MTIVKVTHEFFSLSDEEKEEEQEQSFYCRIGNVQPREYPFGNWGHFKTNNIIK